MRTKARVLRVIGFGATVTLAIVGMAATQGMDLSGTAQAGRAEIRTSGDCSGRSDWKLKVKAEDRRMLETDFEVDQNVNGVNWRVVLKNDGVTFFDGIATTAAPSGSFSVERLSPHGAGACVTPAYATNPATGETCRASIAF